MTEINIKLKSVQSSIGLQKNSIINLENDLIFANFNSVFRYSKNEEQIKHIYKISPSSNCSTMTKISESLIGFGTEDGHIGVIDLTTLNIFQKIQIFKNYTVISISSIQTSSSEIVLFAGGLGKIQMVKFNTKSGLETAACIDFGSNLIESISAFNFKGNQLVFVTCCDFAIHLYRVIKNGEFEYLNSLTGHSNKIKSLAIKSENDEIFIASCSMDNYIRVWKTIPSNSQLKSKNHFSFIEKFDIELESVLLGHTDSVNCVKWSGKFLVSCSSDCAILVWEEIDKTWVNTLRFGQMYGNKNRFLWVEVDQCLTEIYSTTVTGALFCWKLANEKDEKSIFVDPSNTKRWVPKTVLSGHSKRVTGISWSSSGSYLTSCSQDQTTRMYCENETNWTEIARAQIHGYDINTIINLKNKDEYPDFLICGGDEKVVRILEPLMHFPNLHNLYSKTTLHFSTKHEAELVALKHPLLFQINNESTQEVLGLMTKANQMTNFYMDPEEDNNENEEKKEQARGINYVNNYIEAIKNRENELSSIQKKQILSSPPEDFLSSMTLWPEVNKLYGHGYEISAMGCSSDGSVLVSTCKSQSKEHAALIFWDLKNYKMDYSQQFHSFTVLDIKFSGDLILTTGKDRNICLWKGSSELKYAPFFHQQAHEKIIYSLGVGYKESKNYFVSASRDRTVKLWEIVDQKSFVECCMFEFGAPVHSVDFVQSNLVCVGLETGELFLLSVKLDSKKLIKVDVSFDWMQHGKCVNKITRNPMNDRLFASCSDDGTVRVYELMTN